jgi:hypothetical protein
MNIKSGALLLAIFCCVVFRSAGQYALQVGDRYLPIANGDTISKKTLLSADTVMVIHMKPGAKTPSVMKDIIILIQQNGENAGAYIYPSGVFETEVRKKIAQTESSRMIIGQKKTPSETPKGVAAQSKGPTIALTLIP